MNTRYVFSSTAGFLAKARVPVVCAGLFFAAVGLGAVTPSQAQAADSTLSVVHGSIRATTLAGNLNGTEAVLKGNSSAATQTVSGTGDLLLMARGTSCKGKAKVRVYVANKKVKDISLSAAKKFTKYTVKHYTTDATRTVKVRLINNKGTKKCNRDAFVAGSYMSGGPTTNGAATTPPTAPPTTTPPTTAAPTTAPTTAAPTTAPTTAAPTTAAPTTAAPTTAAPTTAAPTTTAPTTTAPTTTAPTTTPSSEYGVPAGTDLKVMTGDLTITTDGTVLDGVDLHGYLSIKADNVTIKNSLLRGGATATSTKALIMAWWQPKNLRVINSTLKADNPSLHVDGLAGSGFTAEGLDISGVVDATKVIGGNVTIRNNWFHDPIHSDNDPNQSDGTTHDDGIQVEGGSAILVENNKIAGFHNAAIQVTQNYAATHGVTVRNNEFSGGACQINVTDRGAGGAGAPIYSFALTSNGFGPGKYGTTCPMRLPKTSSFTVAGNYWVATNASALPNMF